MLENFMILLPTFPKWGSEDDGKLLIISARYGFICLFQCPRGSPILSTVFLIMEFFQDIDRPKGSRFSWGVSKFFRSNASILSEVSWKSYPCLMLIIFWRRRFKWADSLLSDRILGADVFTHVI